MREGKAVVLKSSLENCDAFLRLGILVWEYSAEDLRSVGGGKEKREEGGKEGCTQGVSWPKTHVT